MQLKVQDSNGNVVTDLTLSPSKSEKRTPIVRSTSTTTGRNEPTPNDKTNVVTTSSGGLSMRAKVGIAVGVSLSGLLAIGLGILFLLR